MDNAAFWDRAAAKYARDPISDQAAYTHTLGRMRDLLQPDDRVLEIGCGTGSTALELAPGVRDYIGTDVSSAMIEIARSKLPQAGPASLRFEVAAAGDLPQGPFDAVLALNLLHLLDDMEAVIARIYAALPPGGLFIAKTGLLKDGAWFIGLMIPVMQWIGKAPYVRSLSRAELEGAIKAAGFEITETIPQPGMAPRHFTVARKPG